MHSVEEIKEYAKQILSEKRFAHTVSVADEAKRLALIWGADADNAYLAGIAHDIAKEIPRDEALRLLDEFGYASDETERMNTALLHGPLAAYIVKKEFDIDNSEILEAIRFHTTGRPDMSLMEKIIFIADFTEPLRRYPQAEEVRKLAERDLDSAVLCQTEYVIKFIIDSGRVLHHSTVDTRNYYLLKIKRG